MSDEQTAVVDPPAGEETPKVPTVEELISRIDGLESQVTDARNDNAGLQRRNTDLATEVDTLTKQSLSANDRQKYEAEQAQRKLDEQEKRNDLRENTLDKREIMAELGIPEKFATRIFGKTKEELRADGTAFMEIYRADVKEISGKEVTEQLIGSGEAAAKSGKAAEGQKTLETREDAMNATPEEQLAYLETEMAK